VKAIPSLKNKMKLSINWADEMEAVGLAMAIPKQLKKKKAKKHGKLGWVYSLEPKKNGQYELLQRKTKECVDQVEELFKMIMEERYGDAGLRRAARKKPKEAILALSDYKAGRPTEAEKARNFAMCRFAAKVEAAEEELAERKLRAK
jgi:hypothetical protein